jgi:endoglucanase
MWEETKMTAWRKVVLSAFAFLPGFFLVLSVHAAEPQPVEIPLSIKRAPVDVWSKNRLKPELLAGAVLILKDAGNGAFDDASMWHIRFNQELPHGRKEFSFRIDVAPDHRPLWGQKLLQPFVNGKEADAAADVNGKPSFEKIVADDGKGFIPKMSGRLRFAIADDERKLTAFSLMTAGAENFNITMSDFKVTVWPKADDRVLAQRPLMSELGFRPDETKLLMIEWHDDEGSLSRVSADIVVSGPNGKQAVTVDMPRHRSKASGSRVSKIDLSAFRQPGEYTVTVPSTGPRTKPGTIAFRVTEHAAQLAKHRDDAWGAFYWITDNADGPFPKAHRQDAVAKTFGNEQVTRDISGGWFDAGDYGKYTVNGAYSVGLMLLTGLLAPELLDHPIKPVAGGHEDWPDWLSVAGAQLDWLVKMQGPDGGVNHKATTRDWPGLDVSPEGDRAVKWIMPVSSTATADYAAVMALAAKVLQGQPGSEARSKAALFAAAAERSRQWLQENPDLVMTETRYDNRDYGGPYTDEDDADERFFAAAAWAALTRDKSDITAAERLIADRWAVLTTHQNSVYWGRVDLLGFWALKTIETDLSKPALEIVNAALAGAAVRWRAEMQAAPWAIPHGDDEAFAWGSNSVLATVGWHWLLWAHLGDDDRYVEPARDLAHWFFGRNPLGQTFVTGKSDRAAKDPHFRPSVSGAILLPDGFLVGGPNSGNVSGDPVAIGIAGRPPMRMYIDDRGSYATNEVAINWQAAWALYASLLAAL